MKSTKTAFRMFSLVLVLGMVLSMAMPAAAARTPQVVQPQSVPETSVTSAVVQEAVSGDTGWLNKLHPDLKELVQSQDRQLSIDGSKTAASENTVMVEVVFSLPEGETPPDLSEYFVDGKFVTRNPLGKNGVYLHRIDGVVPVNVLQKIASNSSVSQVLAVVLEKNGSPEDFPIDEPREDIVVTAEELAALRIASQDLKDKTVSWEDARVFGDGVPYPEPKDWFEVMTEGPHKAEAAWNRGFTGEGVTVAVIDDGIDPAHPDLMGTQKLITDPASPYAGWPMVFSPLSTKLAAYDYYLGYSYIANGYPSAHFVDTSQIASLTPCGAGLRCFDFTPLIDYGVLGDEHTYVMALSMTKSHVVHVGTHPDNDLRDYVWGEKPALIVVDPNVAGVYDTVIIDLNDNYDFTDDKPLTKADLGDLENTYNNMVSYLDVNVDGLADISGGMVYYIADGVTSIPTADWLWGPVVHGPGDIIAIAGSSFAYEYSHGTQCTSNIVGQGVINGRMPQFDTNGDGTLETLESNAVYGMAPGAKVVNVSDIYYDFDNSKIDAWYFAAIGYDAVDQTGWNVLESAPGYTDTDAIQVGSNSYGASADYADGWDYDGQTVAQVQEIWAPNLQLTFSTGNGGPGFGTSSPPSPATAIAVGASTEYGSVGWDSIKDIDQITFNDITPFSNRGPGAREGAGVDVVAGGAYAGGDEELNYYAISTFGEYDGNVSWASWGGTSRSAPVAAGVLALVYDAYEETNGAWPTFDTAQALLMSSATDVNYDVYTQGAGSVNADRGTLVASGEYGTITTPYSWVPGDYHGVDYPAFAHVVYPDNSYSTDFTVSNPSSQPIEVEISDGRWELAGSDTFDYSITQTMLDNAPTDTFYASPQWIIPMTEPTWDNDMGINIPLETDLMVVRMIYDYDTFDMGRDYSADTRFRLMVYDWTDQDEDGIVWDDLDADGNVDFIENGTSLLIDPGNNGLNCSNPNNEIDCYEYARFGYNRPTGNVLEMWVQKPLERMHNGLFIGLQQYPAYENPVDVSFEVDYYQFVDHPYLTTNVSSLVVPANDSAIFTATIDTPADLAPGFYEAAIKVYDPGSGMEPILPVYDEHTTVIPVTMNVVADFVPGMTLGGETVRTADANLLYNNAQMRGYFDWGWREESGDGRFFYMDVLPAPTAPDEGITSLLVKDVWDGYVVDPGDDTVAMNDIDTWIYGPSESGLGAYWLNWWDPSYYGPYTLGLVGNSLDVRSGRATWNFNTATGTTEDWIGAPMQEGLFEIFQHNGLYQGDQFSIGFEKEVGILQSAPAAFDITVYEDSGTVGTVSMSSSFDFDTIAAQAFGLGGAETTQDIELSEAANGNDYTEKFLVSNGAKITISTSSAISDIDLYLFYCGVNESDACTSQRGASESGGSAESITVLMPEDGYWEVEVYNYSGEAGTFDLYKNIIQGDDLTVTNVVGGAGVFSFDVEFDKVMNPGDSYTGLILFGPEVAPGLLELNVTITRAAPVAGITVDVDTPIAFPTDSLNYTIMLQNSGEDPVATFDFMADIPDGLSFDSVVSAVGVSYNAGLNRIECLACTLPTGDSEVTLTATIDGDVSGGDIITLVGTLLADHGGQPEPQVMDSAIVTISSDVADLSTSYKDSDVAVVWPGDEIEYSVHIINTGTVAVEVALEDYLSDDVVFVEGIDPFGYVFYDAVDHLVTWSGTVLAGDEVTVIFKVKVADDLEGWGLSIENRADLLYNEGLVTLSLDADSIPVVYVMSYMPLIFK